MQVRNDWNFPYNLWMQGKSHQHHNVTWKYLHGCMWKCLKPEVSRVGFCHWNVGGENGGKSRARSRESSEARVCVTEVPELASLVAVVTTSVWSEGVFFLFWSLYRSLQTQAVQPICTHAFQAVWQRVVSCDCVVSERTTVVKLAWSCSVCMRVTQWVLEGERWVQRGQQFKGKRKKMSHPVCCNIK